MTYTVLGTSGIRVSSIALGTSGFGPVDADAARGVVDRYAEQGGNCLDTANVYGGGRVEEQLGEILRSTRDHFVVATKYHAATGPGANELGNGRKNLVASLEASLRRLRTDRVDLLWLHAWDVFTEPEPLMRALDDQVRLGKVLALGATNCPAWQIARAHAIADMRGWTGFAATQVRYNLLDRTAERELLPMAASCGLSSLAWGPLAHGRLAGRVPRDVGSPAARTAPPDPAAVERELDAVARAHGVSTSRIALAWLLNRRHTVVPVVGATRADSIDDAMHAPSLVLDSRERDALDALTAVPAGFPHDLVSQEEFTRASYGAEWEAVHNWRGDGVTDLR